MARKKSDIVHVVQRLNWVRGDDYSNTTHYFRLPGVVRIQSFDSEQEAEAERDRLEEFARRAVNPFLCGGVHLRHQTSFDADRLHDWLLDADIQPPAVVEGQRDWPAWWSTVEGRLIDDQWRHLWKALDRLNFYEAIARPRRPVVYVLGQIGWRYNDEGFDPAPEGSKPLRVFRSRERAVAECEDENDMARDALDITEDGRTDENGEEYDPKQREDRESPFIDIPLGKAVFYEVVEIELEDQP